MNNTIAILGCGWLGLPLAGSLAEKGFPVHGSSTTPQKLPQLERKGIRAFHLSLGERKIMGDCDAFLSGVDCLVVNVPPRLRGTPKENYVQKMELLCAAVSRSRVPHVLFASSTSVYGPQEGPVTETTPPRPNTESGRQLLRSENLFKSQEAFKTTVVRFGGLIGPNRHPVTTLSGRKGLKNGNHYVNLIQLTDCIAILEGIILKGWWNETFNAVYPYHPTKEKYYRSVAKKRGLQPPEYEENTQEKGKKVLPKRLLDVKKWTFNTSIVP